MFSWTNCIGEFRALDFTAATLFVIHTFAMFNSKKILRKYFSYAEFSYSSRKKCLYRLLIDFFYPHVNKYQAQEIQNYHITSDNLSRKFQYY